ncbi:unnamed protein product [Parnassius apollo]|uniref:(apollo) hypothetical protein n=1 Tax=Parnassius apollo TaxID=110799 RepID=A0A8S3WX50_PARAO|nr:unnamed protein product [Parnassius apollo]
MPVSFLCSKSIILALLLILLMKKIECLPLSNGFSLKFNPISVKEENKLKSFGAVFAKIPQDPTHISERREVLSEAIFAHPAEPANGCTNQIAKLLYPLKNFKNQTNETRAWENANFINIPVIKQHFDAYNILVATAPNNVKLGRKKDALPTVIYVVFPIEDVNEATDLNLPTIYFVNRVDGNVDLSKKEKAEPIFIIDSNRTVTGIKSKEVSKFVRFKNKLRNLYNYEVTRN